MRSNDLRARLHGMWAGAAPSWQAHAAFVDARGAHVSERMLALTGPRAGERVLELACGPGGPGLEASPLVGAAGEVVVSDFAEPMTAIAAARVRELSLENVAVRVLDLEEIDEPDASFDVVLCREGLMLATDPVRAAREIRRVLRPGGRVALSVWGPRARNPWLGAMFDAASEQFGAPVPPPGTPQPFSLEDRGGLVELLTDAGLDEVSVDELATPYEADSAEQWWQRTAGLAGPLARRIAELPAEDAAALRARAIGNVARYETPAGLVIPGVCLIASACRAEVLVEA
ncbi:MAG TPA: class I SAM-dependent methyltransferase [Gaiellales bacterium]